MKQQSITSLPQAPDEERRSRMIKYSVAQGVRVLCIVAVLFVPGWWRIVPIIGAVFLPYFAVVIANVSSGQRTAAVERPGALVRLDPEDPSTPPHDERRP
jgi:hypothetical protein